MQNALWSNVTFKLDEAHFFLNKMGMVLMPSPGSPFFQPRSFWLHGLTECVDVIERDLGARFVPETH